MWFAKQSGSFRAYFSITDATGVLVSGISSSSFTASIIDPLDIAFTRSIVTETTQKTGLYKFDITSSFLVSNGTGSYGVVIESNSLSPLIKTSASEVLFITKADLDSITATAAVDTAAIADAVWDETLANHSGSNTFGEKISKKLLTFAKFIGLK